jgi:hypothetical protein
MYLEKKIKCLDIPYKSIVRVCVVCLSVRWAVFLMMFYYTSRCNTHKAFRYLIRLSTKLLRQQNKMSPFLVWGLILKKVTFYSAAVIASIFFL